jgi:hypothetical protein
MDQGKPMTAIFKNFSCGVLAMALATSVVFPNAASAQGSNVEKPPSGGPRRQLGTIIYAGLGGAVIGLSTLSFYGRPQDKLANIAIGFAVGVIGGTVAVTYSAATNPDEFYGRETPREELLGPGPSMAVVASAIPEESAREISGSFQIFTFR